MFVSEGMKKLYGVPLEALVALVSADWPPVFGLYVVIGTELIVLVTVVLEVLTE